MTKSKPCRLTEVSSPPWAGGGFHTKLKRLVQLFALSLICLHLEASGLGHSMSSRFGVRAAACSVGQENCHPWEGEQQEILYGHLQGGMNYRIDRGWNQHPAGAKTEVHSVDTDYNSNLYMSGIVGLYSKIFKGISNAWAAGLHHGYARKLVNGVESWARFAHPNWNAEEDNSWRAPLIRVSRKAAPHTHGCYDNYVIFLYQRRLTDWLFFLDGSNGEVLHLHKLPLSQTAQRIHFEYGASMIFQNIVNAANSNTNLANYRVFIGWSSKHSQGTDQAQFNLKSRSITTELAATETTSKLYRQATRSLVYQNGMVWFGGARATVSGGSTFRPFLGRARADTLQIMETFTLNTADSDWTYGKIDKLETSANTDNYMMVGVGTPGSSGEFGHFPTLTDQIYLIIGVDDAAPTQWDSVGCWRWSAYVIKESNVYMRRLDDIVGPLMENGVPTLYFWQRQWTDSPEQYGRNFENQIARNDTLEEQKTWKGIRMLKIQNFHNTISCKPVDSVDWIGASGTPITVTARNYLDRTKGFDCPCLDFHYCNNTLKNEFRWTGCGCHEKVNSTHYWCTSEMAATYPRFLGVMSTSRTKPSFLAWGQLSWINGKTIPTFGAPTAALWKLVDYTEETLTGPHTLSTYPWVTTTADFTAPVATATPPDTIIDLSKLVLPNIAGTGANPAIGINIKTWVGQDNVDFTAHPYIYTLNTYNPALEPNAHTHYYIMYAKQGDTRHYQDYVNPPWPDPPGGSSGQNFSSTQININWENNNQRLRVVVPEHFFWRDYQYHVAATNVVHQGISDWVRHYFPCHPDNRGITITYPEPGYYFYVFQRTKVRNALAQFPAWSFTSHHGGCWFMRYKIIQDPGEPTSASDMLNLRYDYFNGCAQRVSIGGRCRLVRVVHMDEARRYHFKIEFDPRVEATPMSRSASILVIDYPPDYLYEATDVENYIEVQSLTYLHTTLTPANSWPVTAFEMRDPDKNWALHGRAQLKLINGNTPATSILHTYTHRATAGWTAKVGIRASAQYHGYKWDVHFTVRVCGEEAITMTQKPEEYRELLYWRDPATVQPSARYSKIPQSTFALWFEVTPQNDPCIVKDYGLYTYWSYQPGSRTPAHAPFNQLKWQNNSQEIQNMVTWQGSMGSYELWIDLTRKGGWVEFYLAARTKGWMMASRKMTIVVCDQDCFRKTDSYREDLEYIVPSNPARLRLQPWLKRPPTDWKYMVALRDCPFCDAEIAWKIIPHETETKSLENFVKLDQDGYLDLTPHAEAATLRFYLEARVQTKLSECTFIGPLTVPVRLRICGEETVIVDNDDPLPYRYTWNSEANDVITNATEGFIVVAAAGQEHECPIVLWELWPTRNNTLDQTGPTEWSTFVKVHPRTGAISVDFNENPIVDQGNSTQVFYLTALTVGAAMAQKEVRLSIVYPYVNAAPTFEPLPPRVVSMKVFQDDQELDFKKSEEFDLDVKGHRDPVYKYFLPRVVDREQNQPKALWRLVPPGGANCNCVRLRAIFGAEYPQPVWIEVDQRRVTSRDAGTYKITVWLQDDQYETSHQQNVYQFSFKLEYIFSVYASFLENTGVDIRPRRADYKPKTDEDDVQAWLKKEDVTYETEADGSLKIVPQLASERTTEIANKETAKTALDEFKQSIAETFNPFPNKTDKASSKNKSDNIVVGESQKFVPTYNVKEDEPEVEMRITEITMNGDIRLAFSEKVFVPNFVKAGVKERKKQKALEEARAEAEEKARAAEAAKNATNSTQGSNRTEVATASSNASMDVSTNASTNAVTNASTNASTNVSTNTSTDQAEEGEGRRLLQRSLQKPKPQNIAFDQLNVTRDLLDFQLRVVSDEDPNLFKYDIYIKEWTEWGMTLHVEFANPLLVSHGVTLDQCRIKILDSDLFVSQRTGKKLDGQATGTLIERFPRQANEGIDVEAVITQARAAVQATGAVAGTVVLSLSCTSTLPGALWSGYYALQLACHLQLFDVYFPASAQIYLDQFTRLVELDMFNPQTYLRWYIPGFSVYRHFFGGARTRSALHHSDELYSIFNDWYFFLCIPFLAVIAACLLRIIQLFLVCVKPRQRVKTILQEFKEQFFYGLALRYIFMIYLKLLASCGRHLEMFIDQSLYQDNLELFVALGMLPVVLGLPAHVWILLEKASKSDGKSKLDRRLGTLCEDLALRDHPDNMLYWPFFLLRRAFFVGIPTFSSNGGLQIVSLLTSNLVYQAWYESVQPHKGKRRLYLERVNEACLFFIFLHIAVFTDWNENLTGKFQYGYSMGFLFGFIVVLNVGFSITTEIERRKRNRYLVAAKKQRGIFFKEVVAQQLKRKLEEKKAEQVKLHKEKLQEIEVEMKKPEIEKVKEVPMTYGKRVMIKPTGLATVNEDDEFQEELNETIYRELGNFGDIAEKSRREILEGFARKDQKEIKKMQKKATALLLPDSQDIEFDSNDKTGHSPSVMPTPTAQQSPSFPPIGQDQKIKPRGKLTSLSTLSLSFKKDIRSPQPMTPKLKISSLNMNTIGLDAISNNLAAEVNSVSTDSHREEAKQVNPAADLEISDEGKDLGKGISMNSKKRESSMNEMLNELVNETTQEEPKKKKAPMRLQSHQVYSDKSPMTIVPKTNFEVETIKEEESISVSGDNFDKESEDEAAKVVELKNDKSRKSIKTIKKEPEGEMTKAKELPKLSKFVQKGIVNRVEKQKSTIKKRNSTYLPKNTSKKL